MSRALRSRRGSTAIEFALIFPILCTLCLAAFEYSAALSSRTEVINSVRETAFAVSGEDVALEDAETYAAGLLELHGFDCSFEVSDCEIDVTVEGDPSLLTVSAQVVYVPLQTLVPAPESLAYSFTMGMTP